jgi:tetratricopeptide (TPR) repeat protein
MRMKFVMVGLLAAGALVMAQKVKSPKEAQAVQAVLSATNPDDRIAAVDSLLAKYKDTEFKSAVLEMAAESYQQKGDAANAIVYGNRALEADPKNYQAMLLVSGQLAQSTKQFDLDKDEKVKQGTKLANDAIATLATAPKPNPQLTDDRWAGIKKDLIAQGHETLGVIASVDKKWDTCITEFKMAVDDAATPEPATMVRLSIAYANAKKYDEAIAMADKAKAVPGVSDAVQKAAETEKQAATKAKAQK